jgi:hypothetical protein
MKTEALYANMNNKTIKIFKKEEMGRHCETIWVFKFCLKS